MRSLLLVLLLLGAGCAAEGVPATPGGPPESASPAARLPAPLRRLVLNEGHPSALPVEFEHSLHAAEDRAGDCAHCHHELRERPRAVPSACTACHLPVYLAPPVDESVPHRHERPPDL